MKLTCERVGGFKSAFLFYNIMEEIWKDVVGYEGFYLVSNMGNVKRVESIANRKYGRNAKGYLQVCLSVHGQRKNFMVHRLVAFAFVWKPQGKTEVNHINGVKTDNRAENLEWVTSSENSIHALNTGLISLKHVTGECSVCSKLTESDVIEIIKMRLVDKLRYRIIGDKYGVDMSAIQQIFYGNNWKHVTGKSELFNSQKLARYYNGQLTNQLTTEAT